MSDCSILRIIMFFFLILKDIYHSILGKMQVGGKCLKDDKFYLVTEQSKECFSYAA